MTRTIVLDGHTLGVIYPPHDLQILKASILRGFGLLGSPLTAMGLRYFDPVVMAGRYREATEQDFHDFGVVFSPHYLEPLPQRDTHEDGTQPTSIRATDRGRLGDRVEAPAPDRQGL